MVTRQSGLAVMDNTAIAIQAQAPFTAVLLPSLKFVLLYNFMYYTNGPG